MILSDSRWFYPYRSRRSFKHTKWWRHKL